MCVMVLCATYGVKPSIKEIPFNTQGHPRMMGFLFCCYRTGSCWMLLLMAPLSWRPWRPWTLEPALWWIPSPLWRRTHQQPDPKWVTLLFSCSEYLVHPCGYHLINGDLCYMLLFMCVVVFVPYDNPMLSLIFYLIAWKCMLSAY